jgi:hypothetical protein
MLLPVQEKAMQHSLPATKLLLVKDKGLAY